MGELELSERQWHALYVRSRSEKKVLSQLQEMGIEAYLPLVTKIKQWSDRRKKIEEPLFKSYVFVYSNAKEYLPILNVYGVMRFVTFEREAVVVPDNQIVAIKRFVEDYEHGEEFKMQNNEVLKVGQMSATKGFSLFISSLLDNIFPLPFPGPEWSLSSKVEAKKPTFKDFSYFCKIKT